MAATVVADGLKEFTSQGDWEGFTWTPSDAVDTTTTPGEAKIATGKTEVVGVSPVLSFTGVEKWGVISLAGTRPAKTDIAFRFRAGTTEADCLSSDWSDYIDSVDGDGNVWFSVGAYVRNHVEFAVYPCIQVGVVLSR